MPSPVLGLRLGAAIGCLLGLLAAMSPAMAADELFTVQPAGQGADFSAQQSNELQKIQGARTTAAVAVVTVNVDVLARDGATLDLPGVGSVRFDKSSVSSRSPTDYSWTGRPQGGRGGVATFTVQNGEVTGHIQSGTDIYRVVPLGGAKHALVKIDPAKFPPDHNRLPPLAPRGDAAPGSPPSKDAAADGTQVDVLVVYTTAARTAYGGNMPAFAQTAVNTSNAVYNNSNAQVSMRLVGTLEISYSQTSFDSALNDLTNGTGVMAQVHTLRDQVGADEVVLMINDASSCGLAWVNSTAAYGFAVVHWDCASSNYSFPHEVGHNFGSRHDPYVDSSGNPFAWGHGYTTPTWQWRTIMAYVNECQAHGITCPRIPNLSNPSVTYGGAVTGTAATHDNARVHRDRVATVAGFRPTVIANGPPNNNFANATAITLGQTLAGTNVGANKETGEPNHAGSSGGASVWWRYTAASSGPVEIKTAGSNFDTLLAVYTGSAVNALAFVASNDDVNGSADRTSRVTFNAAAGTTYRIAVDGYNAATGNIQIAVLVGPAETASHDFNGDGKSDIAWRATYGVVSAWLMNGSTVVGTGTLGSAPSEWQIVGQRDFNGDSKDDLLWRHSNGANSIWFLNGAAVTSAPTLTGVGTDWQVVGTGDFNGDGRGDIVWRQNGSGILSVWLMNGITITASAQLGGAPTVWQVAGVGDFNGDGKSDILFRHSNGATAVWYMNGTAVLSAANPPAADTSWVIVGTGDFNGDGRADILWRQAGGTLAIWLMNGSSLVSSIALGGAPPVWQVTKTGDFNGDGKSDILFRHTGGAAAIWYMNGITVASASYPPGVGTEWTVQSRNAD